MSFVNCEVCSLTLNSQDQLTQHLGGKAHKKKLRAAGLSEDGTPLPPEEANNQEQTTNNVAGKKRKAGESEAGMCSLCSIVFNSAVQAQQHYGGTKHFKKMRLLQQEGETRAGGEPNAPAPKEKSQTGLLYCGFCKIHVNSADQLEIHRQGTKHRKNFDKMKSVPVTYPGTTYKDNNTQSVPCFENYLQTSFVKPESTESTLPPLDSYLK